MESKFVGWPKGTREIAEVLGMRPGALNRAIWERRCPAPPKGFGGLYIWMPVDAERAAWALKHKSWHVLFADHERTARERRREAEAVYDR